MSENENINSNINNSTIPKGMKVCKTCGKPIAKNAKVCPNCGAKQKGNLGLIIGIILILLLLSAISGGGKSSTNSSQKKEKEETEVTEEKSVSAEEADDTDAEEIEQEEQKEGTVNQEKMEPKDEAVNQEETEKDNIQEEPVSNDDKADWTREQKNAYESAKQYLNYTSFSKQGLIDQLSSEYGGNYPEDVAEFAIEQLEERGEVDWYEQAERSARQYLDYSSFSKQGLIDQLSSEYGGKFTHDQAEHAVEAVYDE